MNKIKIKLCDYEGELIKTITKQIGKDVKLKIAVPRVVDYAETRRFYGWDKDINSLTSDSIVTALYTTIVPFEFEEDDGKIYVVGTNALCAHSYYEIPSKYANKKVYGIKKNAFVSISANALCVYIPSSVKDIEDGAFNNCYNTTLLFESKENKAPYKKEIANFDIKTYFNCNDANCFMVDGCQYKIIDNKAILIRCLVGSSGVLIPPKVASNYGREYDVCGIDSDAFYGSECSFINEIFYPQNLETDFKKIKKDYIVNANFTAY